MPEEIVVRAKELGLKSVALTDHGSCHGHADFFLSGKKHGVKTVLGNEAYVIHSLDEWKDLKEKVGVDKSERDSNAKEEEGSDLLDKETRKKLYRKGHMVLLAQNRKGLENIYKMTYGSYKDGFYGKPRMDKKMLCEHRDGVIATSACMGGVISNKCWEFKSGHTTWEEVVREAREFDEIFGRGKFFLELQFNESDSQRFINDLLIKVSDETGIPLTIATDSHYPLSDDWSTQELLYLLRSKKTWATRGENWSFEVKQLYLKGAEDMWNAFKKFGGDANEKKVLSAFENTLLIDSLIESFEPDTHVRLPTLPYQKPFEEMGKRAIDGLKKLELADNDEYKRRLLYEFKIIKEKGFGSYFLVVQQMIQKAKEEGQLVGAGRGSAAGSLVCYALGITDLDPIKYDLMFERFLDPSRTDFPDIDCDFEDVDMTKDMLRRVFGYDNVANLSTYGTFQIKGLLKDLGKVYDVDDDLNKINKGIASELRALYKSGEDKSSIVIRLSDIEEVSPTFNKLVNKYPLIGKHVKRLYSRNKYIGCHASGVIVGDNLPAETAIFVGKDKESGERVVQTSFTEGIVNKNIGTMGFIKFDILGITTLKIIKHALRLIAQRTGQDFESLKENLRPHILNMNDPKVMKTVFWDGHAGGVFQFSGQGIRRLAAQVKPETFDDVSAICSLYRPGPLDSGMHKIFIDNKRNPGDVKYDHPLFEQIMKDTYGTMIYQEQLMKLCQVVGKMELKDVQRIRKNLLKKIKGRSEEFLKNEDTELSGKFVKGCVENGMTEEKAREWWQNIKGWGSYGFNKSHSHSYTVMTMQCAWLATYYPLEFYAALLTKGKTKELQGFVSDIRKRGIRVLPVDVNKSQVENTIEMMPDGREVIRLAIGSVLGVGVAAANKIVSNQPYSSLEDFLLRSGASKTQIIPLIKIGALDSFEQNTKSMLDRYEKFAADPKLKQKKREAEMRALLSKPEKPCEDFSPVEKIMFEIEFVGFTSKGSPFLVLDRDKKIDAIFNSSPPDYSEFLEGDVEVAVLPVMVKSVKEKAQRNKQMMAWVTFGTMTGEEFEAPCFANVWKHIATVTKRGGVYLATVNRQIDDPESLVVGKPGWAHSQESCKSFMVDVDEITL